MVNVTRLTRARTLKSLRKYPKRIRETRPDLAFAEFKLRRLAKSEFRMDSPHHITGSELLRATSFSPAPTLVYYVNCLKTTLCAVGAIKSGICSGSTQETAMGYSLIRHQTRRDVVAGSKPPLPDRRASSIPMQIVPRRRLMHAAPSLLVYLAQCLRSCVHREVDARLTLINRERGSNSASQRCPSAPRLAPASDTQNRKGVPI